MRLPLKYLFPILILLIGTLMVLIGTYVQMQTSYNQMYSHFSDHAKMTGNRLASTISQDMKIGHYSREKITNLISAYMASTLDQADLYDEELRHLFGRHIPSFGNDKKVVFERNTAKKVLQEQYALIEHSKESRYIVGYFPLDLPVQEGEIVSRKVGVLHLVFDMSQEYQQTKNTIIQMAAMNIVMVIIMMFLFSFFMYYFIFKRLDALHEASLQLKEGSFDVFVEAKGRDELTQVIHTFNDMTQDIKKYVHSMQERVDEALSKQSEQSKILIQQSKMASMGEMIGNIAHQWRQPLNALGLLIQKVDILYKRGKLSQDVLNENVQKATSIIDQMSKTIDDFRDFFKPNKQMEYFDVSDTVRDTVFLFNESYEKLGISIQVSMPEHSCSIFGYKNEFSQVIVNLINNAKDALIQNNIENKEIRITAFKDREHTVFRVSDNAGGIDESILDRIFEPYYTTKEEGGGTGIGLYMSKMIVEKNMNGTMQVRNTAEGAEFIITFMNSENGDIR